MPQFDCVGKGAVVLTGVQLVEDPAGAVALDGTQKITADWACACTVSTANSRSTVTTYFMWIQPCVEKRGKKSFHCL